MIVNHSTNLIATERIMFPTRGELVARYSAYTYPTLVTILKDKKVGVIPSSRIACVQDLVDIAMKANKVKNPVTPERVAKWNIIERHKCDCKEGEYQERHMSITVEVFLKDGKKFTTSLCKNDVGKNIARPIEERIWNNNSSKRKSYINTSIFYPITHWIAQELTLFDMWETY